MKPADLPLVWGAPDNSRLTPKQVSFRLPVHVAAQINALCDLYPTRTRTEIVGDLLAAALADLEPTLPTSRGARIGKNPMGYEYELFGPRVDFRARANKHFKEIEKELGNKTPSDLFTGQLVDLDDQEGRDE